MKKIVSFIWANFIISAIHGQSVKNVSYLSGSNEKILQLEIIVPVGQKEAWSLFTKDEQLKKWIAPLAHIELKTGGYIITNYDAKKSLDDSLTNIRLPIINYIPERLLTLKVMLNNNFSKSVIAESQNLQEIIELIPVGKNKTKIVSTMVGFGSGIEWDKTYKFFADGNVWTYQQILNLY